MKPSMLFGYTRRADGLFEKTVHFGKGRASSEKLIRDAEGKLKWVEDFTKTLISTPPNTDVDRPRQHGK